MLLSENPAVFNKSYRAARAMFREGKNPLAEMSNSETLSVNSTRTVARPVRENAKGLSFGIELEYNSDRRERAFGEAMFEKGYLRSARKAGYHSEREEMNRWRWESDCTVSGEVISPPLKDNSANWGNLKDVLGLMSTHLDATVASNVGSHVHIDVNDLTANDWFRLALIISRFEDVIARLSANPQMRRGEVNTGEGQQPLPFIRSRYGRVGGSVLFSHFGDSNGVDLLTTDNNGDSILSHRPSSANQVFYSARSWMLGTGYITSENQNKHLEFRCWDGSLDFNLIELQVKISAAIVARAMDASTTSKLAGLNPCPVGFHRNKRREWTRNEEGRTSVRRNLRGDLWREDTLRFRQFVDFLFDSDKDKAALVSLYAMTNWR